MRGPRAQIVDRAVIAVDPRLKRCLREKFEDALSPASHAPLPPIDTQATNNSNRLIPALIVFRPMVRSNVHRPEHSKKPLSATQHDDLRGRTGCTTPNCMAR